MRCVWMASGFLCQGDISTEFCLACRYAPGRNYASVFCVSFVRDEGGTSVGVKVSCFLWELSQDSRQHDGGWKLNGLEELG